jgi:hypothetical protein
MTLNPPQEAVLARAVHKSLGLNVLLDMTKGDRSYSVLDLGPALKENVRFWSQFSCRLYIHDFYRGYRERKAWIVPVAESEEAAFAALLSFSDETVFDIILAWDLFNYLDLRELEPLVQRLGRWCRRGTRLFAMISSLPKIPASPTIFRILNREQIIYEIPTKESRPCPRYQPRDIDKLMARFTVIKSFLLHNGIREYVFGFK